MGLSPGWGIQPILLEEYVEREKEKDAHILICKFPFIAAFVFLLFSPGILTALEFLLFFSLL